MYRRIPLSIEVKKIIKMLIGTLLGLLLAISAYFFTESSINAEKGYLLKENQIRQEELESQNRILEQQVLEAQSINKLQKSDTVKKLEPPADPIYIKPQAPLTKKR